MNWSKNLAHLIATFSSILEDVVGMLSGVTTNFQQERVSFERIYFPSSDEWHDGYRTVISWIGNGGIFGGTYKKDRDSADEFFISDGEAFIQIPTLTNIMRGGSKIEVSHSRDLLDDRVLFVSTNLDLVYGNVMLEVDGFSYGPVSWKWTPEE